MNRKIIAMCAICASLSLQAQPNILETRPANNSNGKILTMEETILSKELAPTDLRCKWDDDTHLVIFKDGKWLKYDINSEETTEFRPHKARPYAYTREKGI